MLKELFELVKAQATETVINNPDIPNEHNDEVVAEATNTVASGFRNIVAGGGIQSLLGLFENNGGDKKSLLSNPIVSMMMGHFAGKLMNKFGLNNNQANKVSGNLIPDVLSNLINKTNSSSSSEFSLENLLGSITGNKNGNGAASQGSGGGIGDLLKQFTSNGGGGIMDIIKGLSSGAQQQQQQNGNLLDLIKKLYEIILLFILKYPFVSFQIQTLPL